MFRIGSGFQFRTVIPCVPIIRHGAETPCPNHKFPHGVDPFLHYLMDFQGCRLALFAGLYHIEIAVDLPPLKTHRIKETAGFHEGAFFAFLHIEGLAANRANRLAFGWVAVKAASTLHTNDFLTRMIPQTRKQSCVDKPINRFVVRQKCCLIVHFLLNFGQAFHITFLQTSQVVVVPLL